MIKKVTLVNLVNENNDLNEEIYLNQEERNVASN